MSINRTLVYSITAMLLGVALVLPATLWAHGPTPEKVVANFHAALASGDSKAVLAMLLPDAVIYEGGHAETRDEYASHHLEADMAFSAATRRDVVDQTKREAGDVAWIMTRSKTTGFYKDKTIDSSGVETVVLHHLEEGWKIAHIHWSSHSK